MDNSEVSEKRRDPGALWEGFLSSVEGEVSAHVVDTWFRPIQCRDWNDGTVVLEVRDHFFRDWLNDHYLDFVRDGLEAAAGEGIAIEWSVNPNLVETNVVEVEEIEEEPTGVSGSMISQDPYRRPLNRRYHFENFVCGPSNQFAFAAGKAVAEKPGTSYNPLFLFGGVGLGKTHLLSAIGHQVLKDRPKSRIIYASAEQFTQEVINAVLGSKLQEFRTRYGANCDVLLMDDIQLIAGKERTQHEFFHIFNTLYDAQRLIVVTSDKLPHEIPEIEERLRNRFQWGLIADIQPPEIETRVAILTRKARDEGLELPDGVAFFLAERIRSNVRELEGALVRVMAHASLTGSPITVDYARNVLADILASKALKISVESIQKVVAGYYQLRVSDLKSKRRNKIVVLPRQVAMYLCRKHAGASYPDLGNRFGNKDHTTVMSACRKIDRLLKADAVLRSQVSELERELDVVGK